MIYGIGIDIVQVERFNDWMKKPGLLSRFFTDIETSYVLSQGPRAVESLAVRFAAKEALGKSLGTGLRGFNLKEIEVRHREGGSPYLCFHHKALERINQLGKFNFLLSLSHDTQVAVAVVIAEVEGGR
jgi:holo-[acyl-carrier protein] synthase